MAELVKAWPSGGDLSVTYNGVGDGEAVFASDENTGAERTMEVSFVDASRNVIVVRKVRQAAGQTSQETYTRLTYIECNGQQYINTGYVVQEGDVIEITFGQRTLKARVLNVKEYTTKADASSLYEVIE
jgi:ribosomal 50S subunit-recycling heat shock protein